MVWAMKHGHVGDAFFDLDAAQFLLEELLSQRRAAQHAPRQAGAQQQAQGQLEGGAAAGGGPCGAWQRAPQGPPAGGDGQRRPRADTEAAAGRPAPGTHLPGPAVGPLWLRQLPEGGAAAGGGSVNLEYGCEVAAVELLHPQPQASDSGPAAAVDKREAAGGAGGGGAAAEEEERPWPLRVTLTSGRAVGADLLICAIGVTPALDWVPPALARSPDGGLLVNHRMQTGDPWVYAAGDSCSAAWALEESPHWFQMRLWSQARMGAAARAGAGGGGEAVHRKEE